jgi:ferredoxin-NADP reductase
MQTFLLRVAERRLEANDCASLWFEVPADLDAVFRHKPGQFVTLTADLSGEQVARQYSLSSDPGDPAGLRITVKRAPGGRMSPWLVDKVGAGDRVEVATPRGVFFREPGGDGPALLIGAGSGVAPLLPMARSLATNPARRVVVVLCNRREDDIVLRREVDALATADGRVRVVYSLTRRAGSRRRCRFSLRPDRFHGDGLGRTCRPGPAARGHSARGFRPSPD